MHKWRRHAKYAAWYNNDEDPPTFNPFGKVRSRQNTKPRDLVRDQEEGRVARGGVQERALSDPDFRPESAVQRERDFQGAAPKHATTMPGSSSPERNYDGIGDASVERTESPVSKERSEDDSKPGIESEKEVAKTNGPVDETGSSAFLAHGQDEKSGMRNRVKHMFKKDKHDTDLSEKDENGKEKPKFTAMGQLRATLFNSWINVLLIAAPVGIALHFAKVNGQIVFTVNFIAIIPLAALLSYATEEIALRTGETLGGLLNATFGNAVELIVSIIALLQNQTDIVKTSLIGSMLSNLLLVMGMCFFFGGLNRIEQKFNVVVAQTAASLLALAIGALIIPTAFETQSADDQANGTSAAQRMSKLAPLSRGTAIILLFIYACYLFFQLKTHIEIYNAPSEKTEKRSSGKKDKGDASKGIAQMGRNAAAALQGDKVPKAKSEEEEADESETPQLHFWVAIMTLVIATVLVAVCAEFMVDGINSLPIPKTFLGLILIPIVGNAAEHATAVTVAIKDKMDLAIGVAVGSSMQIALLVLPFIVLVGWAAGKEEMNLFFDTFQIAVLFIAVLLVNYLIQDGKSHWLEGVLLQALYILIALAAWFYGGKANEKQSS